MNKLLSVILSLILLLTPSLSFSQNKIDTPSGLKIQTGDSDGVSYTTERYPRNSVFNSLTIMNGVIVGAASSLVSTTYSNAGGDLFYRLLVTGTSSSVWFVKWRGSFDGVTFSYIKDDSLDHLIDTLQIRNNTVNVSPGQWVPLRTTRGLDIVFPFVQAEFFNAHNANATVTVEIGVRRKY